MAERGKERDVASADPMAYNVEKIARLELDQLSRRSSGEKVSDFFGSIMGSMPFLLAHVLGFAVWFPGLNLLILSPSAFSP